MVHFKPRYHCLELTPYSFVVDWAFDVSNYIRNLETAYIYKSLFGGGWVSSIRVASYTEYLNKFVTTNPSGTCSIRAAAKSVDFQRTTLSGWPQPRLPQFHLSMGWERCASAVS